MSYIVNVTTCANIHYGSMYAKVYFIFNLYNFETKFYILLYMLRKEFSIIISLTSMPLMSMQNFQCIAEYYFIL